MEDRSNLFRLSSLMGLIFGAFWCLKYICVMLAFRIPFLLLLYIPLTCFVPFLAYILTKRYRNVLPQEMRFSFMHGWQFSTLLYLFAAVLVAIPHYYFYAEIMPAHMPDIMAQLEQSSGLMTQLFGTDEWREVMEQMLKVRPMSRVINDISSNFFWGALFSIPVGLILKRKATSDNMHSL
ncbi:hypothetical protein PGTDC60_1432 [Porphyromonas gingivalis TDC60]|uniref:DUF4199 domain-containing protein n=1 Tax=Porphyromonas gingivalis TaxID=837 RepID=UPI00020EFFB5|nr:DUF4199 domain-containing protein [Porphyromonas gingivalis]AUR48602.1 hypothetical protein CF002_1432 [Porphyromonas gingivalis]BAK25581.1 hypothetical protein PGTDC60_1432 [Porphyromonas gingivalis TDC60]